MVIDVRIKKSEPWAATAYCFNITHHTFPINPITHVRFPKASYAIQLFNTPLELELNLKYENLHQDR